MALTEARLLERLLDHQEIWFSHFTALSRRADWHVVHHLCAKRRDGASVGEIHGLVKQLFLLDDATVKERILSFRQMNLCELRPERPVTARTLVVPTAHLLDTFDHHLIEFARRFDTDSDAPVEESITPQQRSRMLRPLEAYGEQFGAAAERIFTAEGLSQARALEARRNLHAPSHWNLLHHALLHRLRVGDGLLADQLAATLLRLTGQTMQTSRDHISQLMTTRLLQRAPGKALHVAVSDTTAAAITGALHATCAALSPKRPELVPRAGAGDDDQDLTRTIRRQLSPGPVQSRHVMLYSTADGTLQSVSIWPPQTIGRTAQSDIALADPEISRIHCRVYDSGGRLMIIDLDSTNGTFVNGQQIAAPTPLAHGDTILIGAHLLTYNDREVEDAAASRNESGKSTKKPGPFSAKERALYPPKQRG